jgi:NAD(P)-dependent dehydrogenase (short-subunit alcohol dehydrogenase family)
VLITGAASGIGRATAIRMAADGDAVVVADIRADPATGGEPTEAVIRAAGGTCHTIIADVGDPDDCRRMVAETVERLGGVDVLVNNAFRGGPHSRPLLETTEEDWDAMMAVNLRGPFVLSREAIRAMLEQPLVGEVRGRIVNITSQHGMVASPGHFAYGVGKGGLVQMTRQIAYEHVRDGILCNAVAPGKIIVRPGDTDETLAYSRSRTPYPRLGRPEDVAEAVAFLASDRCLYTSGHNLLVDGGWMAY